VILFDSPCLQTSSSIASSQFQSVGIESKFSIQEFKKNLKIDIRKYDGYDMEFEIEGISCSVSFETGYVYSFVGQYKTMDVSSSHLVSLFTREMYFRRLQMPSVE